MQAFVHSIILFWVSFAAIMVVQINFHMADIKQLMEQQITIEQEKTLKLESVLIKLEGIDRRME